MSGLIHSAWLIPFFPLLGALVAAAGGRWLKGLSHIPVILGIGAAFVVALGLLTPAGPETTTVGRRLARCQPTARADRGPDRRPDDDDAGDGHVRLDAGGRLRRRLHGGRPRLRPVLRVHRPLRLLDDRAGPVEQLRAHVCLLGGRGRLQLPAGRLLALEAVGRGRGQEGVPGQPGRRRRVRDRLLSGLDNTRCTTT